jgi:dihydrofolate synthase / folylpolyglutamate synthase
LLPKPFRSDDQPIAALLDGLARFGVDLSLERMEYLLQALGNPQHRVPIVHVAGSNGKGSVCAYLSSVLTAAGYRVGRYTSPHLVSWRERICINEVPMAPDDLLQRLEQVMAAIDPARPSPTQFEVVTAAAWLYFAEMAVDLAVVEVGLGGRLDATNVVDTPLVSVITSLSREHWQRLGPTLADIAGEKAGILKPGRPAVVGPLPLAAETVVKSRLKELGCPVVWPEPAVPLGDGMACYRLGDRTLTYALPLPGEHQLINSALAIATLHQLQAQGWAIPDTAIAQGLAQAQWPGRLQWVTWPQGAGNDAPLLIDGAHNPAAAQMLRRYVDNWWATQAEATETTSLAPGAAATPVLWLMGMLTTKDHREVFEALLRPGDRLYLVPVPGHLSAAPADLGAIAQSVCPALTACQTYPSLAEGLAAIATTPAPIKVLCGSLYLIGEFFAIAPSALENSALEKPS